jgi:hypothetical protein
LANVALDASGYLNFGTTTGTSGYGFRDNSGTLEFKNSGGVWNSVNTATVGHHSQCIRMGRIKR